MSPCDDFRAQLPLFVGGDLEAPLAARLAEHLGGTDPLAGSGGAEGCADCARALERLRASRAQLLELPLRSPAPEVDLWAPIRAALAAERRIGAGEPALQMLRRAESRRPILLRRIASAAAAVALIALGANYLLQRSSVPQAEPGGRSGSGVGRGLVQEADPVLRPSEGLALPGAQFQPAQFQPASTGGLRRLGPGDAPLYLDAEEFRGWPGFPTGPGVRGQAVDPSHPTLASDRLR